ncbi:MAG: hypothetical protein HQ512_12580 [Rhodospirillales bacterium]|nr:hypothetical protein [Rhodospirillales bacterium]
MGDYQDDDEGAQDKSYPTEQRLDDGGERRALESRRETEDPFKGEEQRNEQDRRAETDRREMAFGVDCKTSGSLTTIEDWLDDHCQGTWKLIILEMEVAEDLAKKNVKVMFELEHDKDQFVLLYGKES